MANRSMLFAARRLPDGAGEPVKVLALGEFGWGIPALYKLLVSANPQSCRSVVFAQDQDLAIAGDRQGGLELLRTLRAKLTGDARAAASLDAAIAYLSKAHIDHSYFLLEPAEILELENGPLDARLRALMTEIQSLRVDSLAPLAQTSDDPQLWATDSWSNILYFEPAGSERPPIDPDDGFLSANVTHLLAHRATLPQCKKLDAVYLTIDGGAQTLGEAFAALSEIPGRFALTLHGALEHLPDQIARLDNVTQLGLGSLGLRAVPDGLAGLPALTGLYLQSNRLEAMPEALRRMPNLTQLCLSRNPLGAVPGWISEMQGLEGLLLDDCRLSAVPKDLWTLAKLKSLNLMANPDLTRLPDGIEGLAALEELNLHACGLGALPEGVCRLPRLKHLLAGNNKLATVPACLYAMPLETISLGGNAMRRPGWFSFGPRFRAKKVFWD